jgi:archaellum component FlaC
MTKKELQKFRSLLVKIERQYGKMLDLSEKVSKELNTTTEKYDRLVDEVFAFGDEMTNKYDKTYKN